MPHIKLPDGVPGIVSLLTQYPDSAKHLSGLAQTVLRGPSSLSRSRSRNYCHLCLGRETNAISA